MVHPPAFQCILGGGGRSYFLDPLPQKIMAWAGDVWMGPPQLMGPGGRMMARLGSMGNRPASWSRARIGPSLTPPPLPLGVLCYCIYAQGTNHNARVEIVSGSPAAISQSQHPNRVKNT